MSLFTISLSLYYAIEQSGSRRQSVFAAAIFTIVFAIFRLVIEVYQMYKHRQSYFADWVNWLEVFTVVFAIIFAWVFNTGCLCVHPWQWQIGTLAVFLAWTDFIIFVQKLPVIGIYVVMLTDILWIFIKTVPLTIMLVIAFALGLFMTFHEPGVLVSIFFLATTVLIRKPANEVNFTTFIASPAFSFLNPCPISSEYYHLFYRRV